MECFWTYLKIHQEFPLFPFSIPVPEQADGDKQKGTVVQAAGGSLPPPEQVQSGGVFQAELRKSEYGKELD